MAGDKTYITDNEDKLHRATRTVAITPTDIVWSSNPNDYTVQVLVDGKWHRAVLTCDIQTASFFNDQNIDKALVTGTDGKTHTALIVDPYSDSVTMSPIKTDDHSTLVGTTTGETALNVYSEEWSDIEWQDNVNVYKVIVTGSDNKKHTALLTTHVPGIIEVIVRGVPPLNLLGAVEDSLSSVKAYGGLLQSGVPSGYTAVEYVENAADTMVKSAIHIGNEDNFKMDITATGVAGSFYLFQARDEVSGNLGNTTICGISGSQSNQSIIGGSGGSTSLTSGLSRQNRSGHKLNIVLECTDGDMSLYVKDIDGNVSDTKTGTYDPTELTRPATNICIYGNEAPTGGSSMSKNRLAAGCKVYGAKLWKNGVLVLDYVPATRNSDSAVGFYNRVSHTFVTAADGSLTAGNSITPTPSDPVDLVCNNGALKILDKSDWTIFTNPTSVAGQGVFISTDGKWYSVNDRGAGCAIPLTIGKQYTLVIHKKTADLGTILRYGQSPQGTPTLAGIQLTDWYRGEITDGQMISFVAKQAYFVMQFSSVAVEAGMIQEAVEVLESQGGDYTFLEYIESTGTQYIETGISITSGNFQIDADMQFTSTTGTQYSGIFGGGYFGTIYNYFAAGGITTSKSADTQRHKFIFSSIIGTNVLLNLSIDGTNYNLSRDVSAGRINFLSLVDNSGTLVGATKAKLYSAQIYDNGTLVGDFIPAIRNSDNAVGMYDTVSGTFFENAGTGTFVAGTPLGDGEVLKLTPSNDTAGVANLLKIDNYVDTQEILTGLINHQLGILVLKGDEDVGWNKTGTSIFRTGTTTLYPADFAANPNNNIAVCSHFKVTPVSTSLATVINDGEVGWNTNGAITFRNDSITTLDGWKSWLAAQYAAGTPVIVVYPLATAQDEVAPVPQTMQTIAGDNVLDIVQAGMSGLEVSATYMKGISVTITEIENANVGNDVEVVIA